MTNINIQYLTDKEGKKTAVLIPINDWENLNQRMVEFMEFTKLKKRLSAAYKDVAEMRSGKKPKQTLDQFLDEL